MNFRPFKFAAAALAALLVLQSAMAQVPVQTCNANSPLTRANTRYEAVTGSNGAEVRDKVTKLIWQRCMLGQSWNGTACTGVSGTYTWQDALDAARTTTASPVTGATAWRVPNLAELYSLAEKACNNPAINSTWFPSNHANGNWTSSPSLDSPLHAWGVSFESELNVSVLGRSSAKSVDRYVRLVRSSQ